jgi:outer membrane protein OmpA-like peptidoglycan-associated protein/tetratricopeptide (TPR) repeat protein
MKTIYTAIILSIILNVSSLAQTNKAFILDNFETQEDYDKAIKYLYQGHDYFDDGIEWYDLALENYLKAAEFNSDNADLNYRMGVCYFYANDNFKSLKYYNKAYKLDPNVNPVVLYRMGQGYQFRMQFNKAVEYYTNFINSYQGKEKDKWQESVNKRLEECKNGKEMIKNFVGGMVVNINKVNSKYIDHSPVISADESTMFFTSRRPTGRSGDVDEYGRSYEDIYFSTKDKNGIWEPARSVGESINSKFHDATISLSHDGKKLYIYDGRKNNGDILVSQFDSVWSEPKALPSPINTKYQETGIGFSPDGKKVYFVSNRPEGVGEMDIWQADVTESGKYKNVSVLSKTINTIYNERAVFVHPDGKTMYFSSEGHKSMGGYDIFKTTLDENGQWGAPENIGYPVNTAGDDIFFVTSADNKRGYFSSVKLNSKGEQDIYMYVFPEEEEELETIVVRGVIRDADSRKPIQGTIVFTDTDTGEETKIKADPETGEFLASIPRGKNYAVNVTADGYTLLSESINPQNNQSKDFLLNLDMDNQASCKPMVLKNVWFEFDKADLKEASFAELNQLYDFLKECNQYNVEINGYTCNAGDEQYNIILSNRRAESVAAYLISKGIDKSRIMTQGYGPKNPMVSNDTRDGRIKNRRVEFQLVSK